LEFVRKEKRPARRAADCNAAQHVHRGVHPSLPAPHFQVLLV
jgi:hypothetical protein